MKNTNFCLRQNFYITKIAQNVCNMFWFLLKHVCISKYINELIFGDFMRIYEILLKIKRPSFYPLKCWTGLLPVDRPVDRDRSRSTGRSTDVHKRAQPRAGRLHGRPSESLCYLEMARSIGRSTAGSFASLRSTARSTAFPNGRKSDCWRSTGQSTENWQMT